MKRISFLILFISSLYAAEAQQAQQTQLQRQFAYSVRHYDGVAPVPPVNSIALSDHITSEEQKIFEAETKLSRYHTALQEAIGKADVEALKSLLSYTASWWKECRTSENRSLLQWAVCLAIGHVQFLKEGKISVLQKLARTRSIETLYNDRLAIIGVLLAHGLNKNWVRYDGDKSALRLAEESDEPRLRALMGIREDGVALQDSQPSPALVASASGNSPSSIPAAAEASNAYPNRPSPAPSPTPGSGSWQPRELPAQSQDSGSSAHVEKQTTSWGYITLAGAVAIAAVATLIYKVKQWRNATRERSKDTPILDKASPIRPPTV